MRRNDLSLNFITTLRPAAVKRWSRSETTSWAAFLEYTGFSSAKNRRNSKAQTIIDVLYWKQIVPKGRDEYTSTVTQYKCANRHDLNTPPISPPPILPQNPPLCKKNHVPIPKGEPDTTKGSSTSPENDPDDDGEYSSSDDDKKEGGGHNRGHKDQHGPPPKGNRIPESSPDRFWRDKCLRCQA